MVEEFTERTLHWKQIKPFLVVICILCYIAFVSQILIHVSTIHDISKSSPYVIDCEKTLCIVYNMYVWNTLNAWAGNTLWMVVVFPFLFVPLMKRTQVTHILHWIGIILFIYGVVHY